MPESSTAIVERLKTSDRLIVALDVESVADARSIVGELRGEIGAFKVGLQLFTLAGPGFVRELTGSGVKVFLDLKFHDIPNTVAKAGVEAGRLGAWMFNVHASGGREMMRRTVEEVREVCVRENLVRPAIIGVTVLTSSTSNTLREVGVRQEVGEHVLNLARLTAECGLDGVVASPHEIDAIRVENTDKFLIVTPGIRPLFATNDDQKRVMTPVEALALGTDYLVIGRPILNAPDRISAVERILEEIDSASR